MDGASSNDNAESELAAEPMMISWRDTEACDANGITLGWGEYYVIGEEGAHHSGSDSDDVGSFGEDGGSIASVEEAVEVPDDEVAEEEKRAEMDVSDHDRQAVPEASLRKHSGDAAITRSRHRRSATLPSLVGLPDTLLEKIINYATERAPQVCTLERVCKRFRDMAMDDDFWARYHCCPRGTVTQLFHFPVRSVGGRANIPAFEALLWEGTRESALINSSLRQIGAYQKDTKNEILHVLSDSLDTDEANAFRGLAASVVSMICGESSVSFRVRGDTVGYLAELLRDYMTRKLEHALLFAIHSHRTRVEEKDVNAALCFMNGSCHIPSLSGTVWGLHGEAGRRIIRRIAFRAGIAEMSNEAFVLAETNLLQTLGILLVDAIEASVEMGKSASYLDADEAPVYGFEFDSVDMWQVPPPPFTPEGDEENGSPMYAIVPGQIRASAERRNIQPCHVYGDTWVHQPRCTPEEEKMIEESFYYKGFPSEDLATSVSRCSIDWSGSLDFASYSSGEDLDSDDDMDWEELNGVPHSLIW